VKNILCSILSDSEQYVGIKNAYTNVLNMFFFPTLDSSFVAA